MRTSPRREGWPWRRRYRHAHIGRCALGPGPFRRIVRDERLRNVPKVIETPRDDDALAADRANLARLRRFRRGGPGGAPASNKGAQSA